MLRQRTTTPLLPLACALSLALAMALGSCAAHRTGPPETDQPRSIAVRSYPAETADTSPPGPPLDGMTNAVVDATVRPANLVVTMWGTPGCMPYPVAVAWLNDTTVEVTTARTDDAACSTEHLAVSQVVVLPVEHPADGVRTVRVDGATVAFAFRAET